MMRELSVVRHALHEVDLPHLGVGSREVVASVTSAALLPVESPGGDET